MPFSGVEMWQSIEQGRVGSKASIALKLSCVIVVANLLIGLCTHHVRPLNGCQSSAEIGKERVVQRPNETLELIDDLNRLQIYFHRVNLNRFHLIGDDCQRSR